MQRKIAGLSQLGGHHLQRLGVAGQRQGMHRQLQGVGILAAIGQGVRQQVNDYMRTVMQEEPVDPSLEILKDEKS